VARIQRSRRGETLRVKVSGNVSAADMGRLEHACSPALVHHALALEIDLRGATSIDRSAAAVLARMADRGARILEL
jgi:anti-anti-sigma regulatory factor